MKQRFLKSIVPVSVSSLVLLTLFAAPAFAQTPLDPTTIPKYATPLTVPSTMPLTDIISDPAGDIDYYEVAAQQFEQQILPAGFPATTVFGFGAVNEPASFHAPGPTIEATVDRRVRIKWVNDLMDPATGNFIPHFLPIDQTIHWANPPMDCEDGIPRTDCVGQSPDPYLGPVPLVIHLHGSHVTPESDGFPEAWYLPAANDIPAGYATQGSNFGQIEGAPFEPGAAYFQYRNDQRATTLWYHPHSLGMTRVELYAGLAGFYLLRGGPSDLPAGPLPDGAHEIPIVIQDRTFYEDGSLFYRPVGQEVHEHFFGDTIVVNGNTWPFLEVEPRRYRLRLLNACNSRDLELAMARDNPDGVPFRPFWVIGADGGFLPAPAAVQELPIHIAERADVIVDFTGVSVGTEIYLTNEGEHSMSGTTNEVMKFVVVPLASEDTTVPPDEIVLPPREPLGPVNYIRQVSLNGDAMLGIVDPDTGLGIEKLWADAITEAPRLNSTEVWEIHNFTDDNHPIHLHLVQFEVIERENMATGATLGPEAWETGTKDTVVAYPDEITRVKAIFDIPGLFVWHCHILEHEDDEMMRPYEVVGPALLTEITLLSPPNGSSAVIRPTFSWSADGGVDNVYVIDFFLMGSGISRSTPQLSVDEWRVPGNIWARVPMGETVAWRVRGWESATPGTVITSPTWIVIKGN